VETIPVCDGTIELAHFFAAFLLLIHYSCYMFIKFREKNLIIREIIGLSVGEVVLPVLVGVIFHQMHAYTLMVSLFVIAALIVWLYYGVVFMTLYYPQATGNTQLSAD
jgi:hypothetical protein